MMRGTVQRQHLPLLILPFLAGACASAESNRDYQQTGPKGEGRKIYSPQFRSDPYLQAQWEASVRSLEAQCERTGQYCAEASKGSEAIRRLPQAR
jgi:hypothetical protein